MTQSELDDIWERHQKGEPLETNLAAQTIGEHEQITMGMGKHEDIWERRVGKKVWKKR